MQFLLKTVGINFVVNKLLTTRQNDQILLNKMISYRNVLILVTDGSGIYAEIHKHQ